MQDIEFTIENEQLYVLQTRSGKRTANAAIHIAVDLVEEGIISKNEAVMNVEVKSIDQLLHLILMIMPLRKLQLFRKWDCLLALVLRVVKSYFLRKLQN